MGDIWRGELLRLGHQGENGARSVQAYNTAWQERFPAATFRLLCVRPGEDIPYEPENVEIADGVLTWTPSATDTDLAGSGKAELQAVEGDTVIKSSVIQTYVEESLLDSGDAPPTPVQNWIDNANQIVQEAAEAAAEAAGAAPTISGHTMIFV